MFPLSLLTLVLAISLIDICTFRIPNILSILFFLTTAIDSHRTGLRQVLITLLILSIVFISSRIGMGDLKLVFTLLINEGGIVITSAYLNLFALSVLATVLIHLYRRRSLKGSTPFAPAILAPFALLYLAI